MCPAPAIGCPDHVPIAVRSSASIVTSSADVPVSPNAIVPHASALTPIPVATPLRSVSVPSASEASTSAWSIVKPAMVDVVRVATPPALIPVSENGACTSFSTSVPSTVPFRSSTVPPPTPIVSVVKCSTRPRAATSRRGSVNVIVLVTSKSFVSASCASAIVVVA